MDSLAILLNFYFIKLSPHPFVNNYETNVTNMYKFNVLRLKLYDHNSHSLYN